MLLTVKHNGLNEGDYRLELADLEDRLPNWAYTRKEFIEYTVRRQELLNLIKIEEEYQRECKRINDSS